MAAGLSLFCSSHAPREGPSVHEKGVTAAALRKTYLIQSALREAIAAVKHFCYSTDDVPLAREQKFDSGTATRYGGGG